MKLLSRNPIDVLIGAIEQTPASDRLLLRVGFFLVIGLLIFSLHHLNSSNSETSAVTGGTIIEGIVGTPRFVNPVLALTRADQDVTALVYSGLMRIGPDGTLVPDVAETVTVSEDGLVYTVTLRRDVTFHDGTPLSARDVLYTIGLIQDPDLKSPLRGNWTDVTVTETNDYEIIISLNEAYAPFIENFTVGIMPAHVWSELPIEQIPFSQLNTEPIGSGPFQINRAERDTSGIIDHYVLTAYRENGQGPNINTFELRFFQNEEELITALKDNVIDATAYLPVSEISSVTNQTHRLIAEPLPRTFGVFFNQNRSTALRDEAARNALTVAIDRDALIDKTLFGYGVPIHFPTTYPLPELESEDDTTPINSTSTESARDILLTGGWEQNELGLWEKEINGDTVTLSITLRTSNTPFFDTLAQAVAEQWRAVGVDVVIEQFEQAGLVQSVIRSRDFQALLFGLDMNRSQDLFPFWHSSQQDDPGLNIAQYANLSVDELLESARGEQDEVVRRELLAEAGMIIASEQPAIFLFQPTLTYVVDSGVNVGYVTRLGKPSDRFIDIVSWHTETESLWPYFRNTME